MIMLSTIADQGRHSEDNNMSPGANSMYPSPSDGIRHSRASAVQAVRHYIESLPHPVPFKKEIRNLSFWRAVWAEFLVTLLFLVVGCGAEVKWSQNGSNATMNTASSGSGSSTNSNNNCNSHNYQANNDLVVVNIKAAFAMGLTVASLVHSTAHVSGCHLNPAISISLLVTRNISLLRTVAYVIVQCVGATVGAGILCLLTPYPVRHSGLVTTVMHPDVHPSQAFGVEFLITLLITMTLMASWDHPNSDIGCKAVIIGLSYTVGHLFGYPYTGAGMNPARSLALALITSSWKYHWIYWVGPILGGILGGFTYEYIRETKTSNCYQLYNYGRQWNEQQLQREQSLLNCRQPEIKRDQSVLISTHETELTTTASNDYRV